LIKINGDVLVILFAQKQKNKPTAYIPLLLLLSLPATDSGRQRQTWIKPVAVITV